MIDKKLCITVAITILLLSISCSPISSPNPGNLTTGTDAGIPYYFIAIHNEPYNVPGGRQILEKDYGTLVKMVERANSYGIKLTLMFTAQWADFISESPDRMTTLKSWVKQGHEIAAHHHGIGHGNWDGYTDLTKQEALARRTRPGKQPEPYLGTLEDYIEKLKKINPGIHSGCLNDEGDKRELPDDITCDTCGGWANVGEPGRIMSDAADPSKGINEYVSKSTYNGIERKWLTHYQVTTAPNMEKAKQVFSSMSSGVYGAVTHSIPVQAEFYYSYLEFMHSKDPSANMSRTVSQILEGQLLPEREIRIISGTAPVIKPPATASPLKVTENLDSPFGIFGAYALEYASFQKRAGLNNESYWNWVDGHFLELGAHWTRSNLQLIWDMVEPEIGKGYRWENQFATDRVISRISGSPAAVNWIGVFHEGGKSPDPARLPLREPMEYPLEYSRFVEQVVERYDGDGFLDMDNSVNVKYWQVGNEYPGWERKGKTTADYIAWAKLTSSAIKKADPQARVILIADTQAFALSSWLVKAVEELAPGRFIDAVDLHHWGNAGNWKMPAVAEVRSLLDRLGRPDAEIFSCENGTWTGKPDGQPQQTEEEQARSLVKRFVYNLNNGLDKLLWNNLMEWDRFGGQAGSIFNSMGLVSDGLNSGDQPERFNTARICYWSYQMLARNLGNDIKHGESINTGIEGVYLYSFSSTGAGTTTFIGWAENGRTAVTFDAPGFAGKMTTLVPDRYGNTGTEKNLTAGPDGKITLELSPDPVLVSGTK